jgi:hypothetical protein
MECFENKKRIVVKIRRQQATAIRIVSASVENISSQSRTEL